MNIPFRVKKLTDTAKIPTKENDGDLWDLYTDEEVNVVSLTTLINSVMPGMIPISYEKFAQNVKKIIKEHDEKESEEFLKALKDEVGKHEKELENINKELTNAKAKLKDYYKKT